MLLRYAYIQLINLIGESSDLMNNHILYSFKLQVCIFIITIDHNITQKVFIRGIVVDKDSHLT